MTVDGQMVQGLAAIFSLLMLSAAFWLALRYAD